MMNLVDVTPNVSVWHEWHCREICLESAQRDDSR